MELSQTNESRSFHPQIQNGQLDNSKNDYIALSTDLSTATADDITVLFKKYPFSFRPVDYSKLIAPLAKPSTSNADLNLPFGYVPQSSYKASELLTHHPVRLIMFGDTTHGTKGALPKEFRRIIRQLTPSISDLSFKFVALEMFTQNWQPDFDRYFEDPNGKLTDGRSKRDVAYDHIKKLSLGDAAVEQELIESVETIRQCGMKLVCIEAPVPHIWDEGTRGGWKFPVDGLEALLKKPNGAKLLAEYAKPRTSRTARKEILAYFKTQKFKRVDGKDDTDPDATANDLMETLDAMHKFNFDFPSMIASNGTLDTRRFSLELVDWRNRVMAEKIDHTLEANPESRMIVSAGSGHFGYQQKFPNGSAMTTLNEALLKRDELYASICFAFGERESIVDKTNKEFADAIEKAKKDNPGTIAVLRETRENMLKSLDNIPIVKLSIASIKAGLSDKDFLVEIHKRPSRPFDYYVHLGED